MTAAQKSLLLDLLSQDCVQMNMTDEDVDAYDALRALEVQA